MVAARGYRRATCGGRVSNDYSVIWNSVLHQLVIDLAPGSHPGTVPPDTFDFSSLVTVTPTGSGTDVDLSNASPAAAGVDLFVVYDDSGNDIVDARGLTHGSKVAIFSGGGDDVYFGGAGNDYFLFKPSTLASTVSVTGGAGFDSLQITAGGAIDASAFAGVSGVEALILSDAGNNVTLGDGLVGGSDDGYFVVADGAGNDVVDASSVTSRSLIIHASGGKDTLKGGSGADYFTFATADLTAADTVVGGAGNDVLVLTGAGTVGASAFSNVSGIELIYLRAAGTNLTPTNALAASSDVGVLGIVDQGGNDVVDGSGITNGVGLQFYAGGGHDTFKGGSGNDVFIFTASDLTSADTLDGGTGVGSGRNEARSTLKARSAYQIARRISDTSSRSLINRRFSTRSAVLTSAVLGSSAAIESRTATVIELASTPSLPTRARLATWATVSTIPTPGGRIEASSPGHSCSSCVV